MMNTNEIKWFLLKWYGRAIVPLKIVGILFLLYHLYTTPQTYDFIWIFIYLGIAIIGLGLVSLIFYLINLFYDGKIEDKFFPKESSEDNLLSLYYTLKRSPWLVLLIPGEDGIFFLPLLYIGITPLTATIAALLFGFAHITSKPLIACFITSLIAFVSILIVLPHGILPICAGHIILDISIFSVLPAIIKRYTDNNEEESFEPFDDFDELYLEENGGNIDEEENICL